MDLAVFYPGRLCRDTDPLLLVQVTEFTCGGFVVGVTWNHVLGDGAGTAQLLHAVAELARGGSAPPLVRAWDDGVSCRSRLPAPALFVPISPAATQHKPPPRLARLDVVIPSGVIRRVKAGEFGGEPCTAMDAVMAVLWRCRTHAALSAAGDNADSPAPLKFMCNMRELADAPSGYYGNCIRAQVVPATVGEVAGGRIGDLVRLIRRAKEKIPDLLSGSGAGGVAAAPPEWYKTFLVTDWRYLGLETVDFGGGTPARVLWNNKRVSQPCCVVCPPPRDGNGRDGGGVEVSIMLVKPEHADAFLGELAKLAESAE